MTSRPTHRPPRPPVDLVASRAAPPIAEVAADDVASMRAFLRDGVFVESCVADRTILVRPRMEGSP